MNTGSTASGLTNSQDSHFVILGYTSELTASFGIKEIKMCSNANQETPVVEMRRCVSEQPWVHTIYCASGSRSYSGNFGFFGFTSQSQNPNSM